MKYLITGGAGFIGSHLADKLIKEGHKVTVIDDLSAGKKKNLNKRANFFNLDIRSPKVSDVFIQEKPEVVYHLAAQIDVGKSLKHPREDAEINILGSLNLLKNCQKFGIEKFIFISSAGIYGDIKELPIKENSSINPISPYSITKLTIEKYLDFYKTQGLDSVILRFSNVYGPRQSSLAEGGVVSIFIDKILNKEKPIIFGDGEQTRDFLYVDDAVEAAYKMLNASTSYNAGTNQEASINDLLAVITSEKNIKALYQPARKGEIARSRVDYSKIKEELGWQPKYSLEQGIKKTMDWFLN